MHNIGSNIPFCFSGFKAWFCTLNRIWKILFLTTFGAKGEIWWDISEKGRKSQVRKRGPCKKLPKHLYRRSSFSSETTGSCDKYLHLTNVFKLCAEILTSAYDKDHNSGESRTNISVVIVTDREISTQTHIYCFTAFPLLIHVPAWWMDILQPRHTGFSDSKVILYRNCISFSCTGSRAYIIILFSLFYL